MPRKAAKKQRAPEEGGERREYERKPTITLPKLELPEAIKQAIREQDEL